MERFYDQLAKSRVILADGAMGTLLHSRGIGFERVTEQASASLGVYLKPAPLGPPIFARQEPALPILSGENGGMAAAGQGDS